MRKTFFCILVACGLVLPAYSSTPTPTINTSLDAVLRKLSSSTPGNEVTQIEQAIHASPALLGQLDALASSGKLKTIAVKSGDVAAVINGASFGATFDTDGMVLAETFLGKQNRMAYDVRTPNEVLPNNTVFVLGHLAYHLRDTQYVEEAAHRAANEDAFMTHVMRNEAGAFIQGWNDVVDAATVANGNKPLLPGQVGQLLINLRYRSAFLRAMNAKSGQKLAFLKDGRIEASDQNLNVMAAALRNSPMADIE